MKRNKQAFTLIELLVVVLIIGILAAVALPQYTKAVEKSRMAEAVTLIEDVLKAESIYRLANGVYTGDLDALDLHMPGIVKVTEMGSVFTTKNFTIMVGPDLEKPDFAVDIIALRKEGAAVDRYFLQVSLQSFAAGDQRFYLCGGNEILCKSLGSKWEFLQQNSVEDLQNGVDAFLNSGEEDDEMQL